jgi:hypothetical protein
MFLQNDGIDLPKSKTLTLYFMQVQRSCGGEVQLSTFDNLRYALLKCIF